MNKILWFFYNNRVFFLFIFLEIISVIMVVEKNDFQHSRVFNSSVVLMARCHQTTATVNSYFGLRQTNELLAEQNAQLLNQVSILSARLSTMVNDSLLADVFDDNITYVPAKVIYNSIYRIQNHIILDKGRLDGIVPDMGVLAPQGVVGVVQRVSDHFSVVLPILNPQLRISAKIKSNNQLGSIVWDGSDPASVRMEEIPRHVNPIVGDTIITSGYSAIFPSGCMIGTINRALGGEKDAFCNIEVRLAVDFQSLDYVVVTAMDNKTEFIQLKDSVVTQ